MSGVFSKVQHGIRIGLQAVHDAFSSSKSGPIFNPYKMLLIGETGSGKTSFLNLLCNYVKVKQLASNEFNLEILQNFHDVGLEHAQSKQMESKTSGTVLYNIELNGLKIGVIDTPGFGDSRGMDEDKQHTQRIIAALKEVEHVNCICLVINGRIARMTASLRYVLAEITAILPKNILNNVVVVFTNTTNVLNLNFDIESLTEYFGKEIEECFFIENPYCQFEKAVQKQNKVARKLLADTLQEGFQSTGKVLDKMHASIKDFKDVHTNYFTRLYEKKIEIELKVLDVLAAYDSQVMLTSEMKRKQEEIEAAKKTKKLNSNFQTYTTTTRWIRKATPYKNTLCGAPYCYKTCHENCRLRKSFNPEDFKHCGGVGGTTCRVCDHDYRFHYHNEAKMVEETETKPLIDDKMKKKFEEAENADKMASLAQSMIAMKIKESEDEKKTLSHKLLLTMEEFHELGLNKNYAKLLESHLFAVKQRKEASDDQKDIESLTKTEEEIQKKIDIVRSTLNEPWSPRADPKVQRDWACKMLNIDPSSQFTSQVINKASRNLLLKYHPDKQGNEETAKKINRASEILQNCIRK